AVGALAAAPVGLEEEEADPGEGVAREASAEAQLARAKVQLDLHIIRAPREGRILQVNTRAGEYASPTTLEALILLGQVEQLQLRVDIDEDNASRIQPAMSAKAYIKGRRDVEIPLTFVRIEPYILPKKSLTGESSERVDTRVLQIIYRFERPKGVGIYAGQQMDVFLDAGKTGAP
ncbi:MAG: HlyD family efflux transporter periplasmic adaptor subunit, partial [Chthoniobacteraceae bacterium]